MPRHVRVVPASPARVTGLSAALAAALAGTGPAVLPVEEVPGPVEGTVEGTADRQVDGPGTPVPDEVALLVRTSGSTGSPREVLLTADALRASAEATHRRLDGPGRWLLALPTTHVAGLQVLVRSVVAGTTPEVLDGPFRAEAFAAATRRLPAGDGPRYTSLVPTQVHRLLDSAEGRDALLAYDAVLLGGAAAPPALVARARGLGARVVTTYGMSETCGGCVYDGLPLDGVRVELAEDSRIRITGPVLAAGYRDRPDLDAAAFEQRDGARWLRTSDLGRWEPGPTPLLEVLGRADDVLVTGGAKVPPAAVERVLASAPGVGELLVVGVPDAEWGQALVAVVVPAAGTRGPDLADLRRTAAAVLGGPAAPRHLVLVDALPLRGPGKPDRRGATELAARSLGRTSAHDPGA